MVQQRHSVQSERPEPPDAVHRGFAPVKSWGRRELQLQQHRKQVLEPRDAPPQVHPQLELELAQVCLEDVLW